MGEFLGMWVSLVVVVSVFLMFAYLYENTGLRRRLEKIGNGLLAFPYLVRKTIYIIGVALWFSLVVLLLYFVSVP